MAITLPKIYAPITVDTTNNKFDFSYNSSTYAATLTAGTYQTFLDFRTHLQAQITAECAGSLSFALNLLEGSSNNGRVLGTEGGSGGSILFSTGANAAKTCAVGLLLGYSATQEAGDLALSVAGVYGDNQHVGGWYPTVAVTADTGDQFVREGAQTVAMGGQNKFLSFGETTRRIISFTHLAPERTRIAKETLLNTAVERIWRTYPDRFTWFADWTATSSASGTQYFLLDEALGRFEPTRMYVGLEVYSLTLPLGLYTA